MIAIIVLGIIATISILLFLTFGVLRASIGIMEPIKVGDYWYIELSLRGFTTIATSLYGNRIRADTKEDITNIINRNLEDRI